MSEVPDLFDKLPAWARLKLFVHPGHKDWKQCNNCHVYKDIAVLKACACSKTRIRPIYYCGKECQRANWQSHKFDCKFFRAQPTPIKEVISGKDKDAMRLWKMLAEWEFTNSQTWSMRVAYHYNPSICPSQVVFDIIVEAPSQQIVGFCFTPKIKVNQGTFFTLPELKERQGRDQLWYRILATYKGRQLNAESIHRAPPAYSANVQDLNFPEWPWIASELTRYPNNSSSITDKKWDLLLTAVEFQRRDDSEFFSEFVAPKMCIDQRMVVDKLDDWYKTLTSFDTWALLTESGYVAKVINRE
ncbi:hypothetical protein M408DRAFT_9676 [Serendipita vermifera MAFF 305830]|uniref:MYND-type domain-containing protein n=1 Tax=Serendipita vermifera MAFF 305830 TaxID=933852 RepID=A0A0C3AQI0_SERVB|nr:hypothetical protein M408DRAFT_9676 [Serendipita vermifera MAFF 305830]